MQPQKISCQDLLLPIYVLIFFTAINNFKRKLEYFWIKKLVMVRSFEHALRKRKREKDSNHAVIIKGMLMVVLVATTAGVLIVLLITLSVPTIKASFSKLFAPPKSPLYKSNLDLNTFHNRYQQAIPIYFTSMVNNETKYHIKSVLEEWSSSNECPSYDSNLCSIWHDLPTGMELASDQQLFDIITHLNRSILINSIAHVKPLFKEFDQNILIPLDLGNVEKDIYFRKRYSEDDDRYNATLYPSFTIHSQGWEDLIIGRKKWFFYKPNKLPSTGFDPSTSIYYWLETVYPFLSKSDRPIELIQEAGQTVYIPQSWYRASIPIGIFDESQLTSVGKSLQRYLMTPSFALWIQERALEPEQLYFHHAGEEGTWTWIQSYLPRPLTSLFHGEKGECSTTTEGGSQTCVSVSTPSPPSQKKKHLLTSKDEQAESLYFYLWHGQKALQSHNIDDAIAWFTKGLTLGKDFNLLFHLASCRKKRGETMTAINLFKLSLEHNKLNSEAYVELIDLYLESFMFDDAAELFAIAEQLSITNGEKLQKRAVMFRKRS